MLTIKHLDHISMGHESWQQQSDWLQRVLGFKRLHAFPAGGGDFDGSVSQAPGTDIEFEVISPVGPKSFVQKFLNERGPGLHHITVEVPDIEVAAIQLEALGLTPFGGITQDSSWKMTYVHPKESGGILWQLFEPYKHLAPQDRSTTGGAVNLKRVDHVSMAVRDLQAQIDWQERVFGMEQMERWSDDALGYDGCVMRIPNSQLQFEIIAPATPDSFVEKYIATRGQGMHHICCEVASVDAAATALRAEGIEPFGGIIESDWHRHTFIHPRDSGGVLFQLFEE